MGQTSLSDCNWDVFCPGHNYGLALEAAEVGGKQNDCRVNLLEGPCRLQWRVQGPQSPHPGPGYQQGARSFRCVRPGFKGVLTGGPERERENAGVSVSAIRAA